MKFTTLLGSARKKGNTAKVLGWIEEELVNQGHEVSRITLHDKAIHCCLACAKCKESPDAIDCVQKDDAIEIMEQMIAADGVVFASPLYFWGFSAQIKALIDRSYSLVTKYHQPGHTSLMKGKRIGLLVTGAGTYENNAEGVFTAFDRLSDFYLTRKIRQAVRGPMHHRRPDAGGCETQGRCHGAVDGGMKFQAERLKGKSY